MKKTMLLCVLFALAICRAEVVVVDQLVEIREKADVKSVGDTIKLIGPRNGYCSASVVNIGKGEKASITDLKSSKSTIPASNIQIRYASKDETFTISTKSKSQFDPSKSDPKAHLSYYDILNTTPQTKGALHPILMTVKIPKEISAGLYKGYLKIGNKQIPIELTASNYIIPNPNEWTAHSGIDNSPETLAEYYKIKEWSPEHWKLIEEEFKYMGGLGADELLVPIIPTNPTRAMKYSHSKSWIDFTDPMNPDFSIIEKYISLYVKTNGVPKFLILDMWRQYYFDGGLTSGQKNFGSKGESKKRTKKKKGKKKTKICNTFINFDGKDLPLLTIDKPDSEKIWSNIFSQILNICKKNGIPKESILIGLATDSRPNEQFANFITKIAPYAKWQLWTHGRGDPMPATTKDLTIDGYLKVGIYVHPYVPTPDLSKIKDVWGGWSDIFPSTAAARNGIYTYAPLSHWRGCPSGLTLSSSLMGGATGGAFGGNGLAHIRLDFWDLGKPSHAKYYKFLTLTRNNARYMIVPGEKGPLSTMRYEFLREGLQELEARIVLEKALNEKTITGKLETEVKAFLQSYCKALYDNGKFEGGHYGGTLGAEDHLFKVAKDWQKMTTKLFELAGQIQTK